MSCIAGSCLHVFYLLLGAIAHSSVFTMCVVWLFVIMVLTFDLHLYGCAHSVVCTFGYSLCPDHNICICHLPRCVCHVLTFGYLRYCCANISVGLYMSCISWHSSPCLFILILYDLLLWSLSLWSFTYNAAKTHCLLSTASTVCMCIGACSNLSCHISNILQWSSPWLWNNSDLLTPR